MPAIDVARRLKRVPLFANCSGSELRRIATAGWVQDYAEGHTVCEEGKGAEDFFVILDGDATVRRRGKSVRGLHQGDHFGEIGLFKQKRRTATVTAITPLRCFVLGRTAFRVTLQQGDIALKLLYTMAERLDAGG